MPFLAPPVDPAARDAWLSFQEIPDIDGAVAHDLIRLGIRNPVQLAGQDPQQLYRRISGLDGFSHDARLIDTYQVAIQAARAGMVTNPR